MAARRKSASRNRMRAVICPPRLVVVKRRAFDHGGAEFTGAKSSRVPGRHVRVIEPPSSGSGGMLDLVGTHQKVGRNFPRLADLVDQRMTAPATANWR